MDEVFGKNPLQSPDTTKYRTVRQGDSLWAMAAHEYGEASQWREIAAANVQEIGRDKAFLKLVRIMQQECSAPDTDSGVYLLARLGIMFSQLEYVLIFITFVGMFTALWAAIAGLLQNDIKKVLAYSTISQLGYMFMAAGVCAFDASIFHVFTHAFFKAALFLGAGAVIHSLAGEQDMRRMGGLINKTPATACVMKYGPCRFVFRTVSKLSSVASRISARTFGAIPALFTRKLIGPSSASILSKAASRSAAQVMLPWQ